MFRFKPNREPCQHSCVPEMCVQNYYITLEKMSYLTTVIFHGYVADDDLFGGQIQLTSINPKFSLNF